MASPTGAAAGSDDTDHRHRWIRRPQRLRPGRPPSRPRPRPSSPRRHGGRKKQISETRSWTAPPLVRDSFSMIGSAIGGTAGAFYGFNHGYD